MGKLRVEEVEEVEEVARAHIGMLVCSKSVRRKIRQMNLNGKRRVPTCISMFLAVITEKQSFLIHRTPRNSE
jgi:hypothetical protein